MAQRFREVFGFEMGFHPDQTPYGPGSVKGSIYRGLNVWVRTNGRLESFGGVFNQSETVTASDQIYALDQDRGTIYGGNCARFMSGANFFIGPKYAADGITANKFRVNGSLIYTLTVPDDFKLKLDLDGTIYDAGIDAPAAPLIAAGAASTILVSGDYSIRLAARRSATTAVSNPSAYAGITTVNTKIAVKFPAPVTGQDQWVVGVTQTGLRYTGPWFELLPYIDESDVAASSAATGTVTLTNGSATLTGAGTLFLTELVALQYVTINGVTYQVQSITNDTHLTLSAAYTGSTTAGLTLYRRMMEFEWSSAQLVRKLVFNLDPPPQGKFVAAIDDVLLVISTDGAMAGSGPGVSPSLPGNPEAFDPRLKAFTAQHDTIIGIASGQGQIFLMCTNSLQVVRLTGNSLDPVVVYPLWGFGFANQNGGCFADGRFYGFSRLGPVRSSEDGNPDHAFAAPVRNVMQPWTNTRVKVVYDPKNQAVLFMHSGTPGSTSTEVLAYMLATGVWSTTFVPTDPAGGSANMAVSGAATINGNVYFTTEDGKTYIWDSGGLNTVSWSVATPFSGLGADHIDKRIDTLRVTANSNGTAGIWIDEDIINLNNGTNAEVLLTLTGGISTTNTSGTVAVATGSPLVVGVGTLFLTELTAGEQIIIDDINYTILSIQGNLLLTLTANASTTGSGLRLIRRYFDKHENSLKTNVQLCRSASARVFGVGANQNVSEIVLEGSYSKVRR